MTDTNDGLIKTPPNLLDTPLLNFVDHVESTYVTVSKRRYDDLMALENWIQNMKDLGYTLFIQERNGVLREVTIRPACIDG